MRKNAPTAADDLAMPLARRRWAAVEHMTVRGWSAAPAKCRQVAGRMAAKRDGELAAARVIGSDDRRKRALGSGAPLFATRVAGHQPVPTRPGPRVVARRSTDVAREPAQVAPGRPAIELPAMAGLASPALPLSTEPGSQDPSLLPARGFTASAANQWLPGRLRIYVLTRWRSWLEFSRWRTPREVNVLGWRTRMEPTLLASFAVIAAVAAIIGLYSLSTSGMYHPVTAAIPSQTNGPPPQTPPSIRAQDLQPAPKAHRTPASDGPSGPQAYASWPATKGHQALGSALATAAAPSRPGLPRATRTSIPPPGGGSGGGGGGNPTPTPSGTPTPSDTPPDSSTPTDVPTPSDTPTDLPTDLPTLPLGP